MSEFRPITTLEDLNKQDSDEIVAGYRSGLALGPEPGSDKSRAFWHGWRNGMMDRGELPHDEPSWLLIREYSAEFKRKGMH